MNKHAYLIVANNNWKILNMQIKLLDCKYNDIYLLVDKKSTDFDEACLPKCKESNLHLVSRRDIYWAGYSQVQAFLDMMKMAECNAEKIAGGGTPTIIFVLAHVFLSRLRNTSMIFLKEKVRILLVWLIKSYGIPQNESNFIGH